VNQRALAEALRAAAAALVAVAAAVEAPAEGIAPEPRPAPPKRATGRRRGPTLAERLDRVPSATVVPAHQLEARRALKRAGEPVKE